MSRKEELLNLLSKLDDKDLVNQIVDEIIFLENQLNYLKTLPFIKVNPNNPSQQKETPASKQYHHMLQAYNNNIKILISFLRKTDSTEDEEDAFQQFIKKWSEKN